jgi:S1-C subfamily serine protease
VPASSADKAGIKENDYIEFLDNRPIKESFDLIYEISKRSRGVKADLIIDREGTPLSLEITFEPLPPMKGHGKHGKK